MVRDEFPAWLEVGRADLFVYDAGRRKLHERSFYDVHPAGVAGRPEAVEPETDLILSAALRRRRPVSDAGRAAVPLLGRDHVLGILRLENNAGSGDFDQVMIARASMAAAALVSALERATLHAELRHGIRLQSALVALCRTVNGPADLQKVLHDIYGIVAGLVPADYFNIAVKDPGAEPASRSRAGDAGKWWLLLERDLIDGRPWEDNSVQPAQIHGNEALRAIQTQPYWILHRTPEEIRALEDRGPHLTTDGWISSGNVKKRSRSILYVPLRTGGDLIGYVTAQSYAYNAYSIREAEDLILIGEYVGLAVQNVWRREKERKELEEARRKLAELGQTPT